LRNRVEKVDKKEQERKLLPLLKGDLKKDEDFKRCDSLSSVAKSLHARFAMQ
jgi:hypothetical protein